jgi:hypothetical protein
MGMGGELHIPFALPQGKRAVTHFIGGRLGPSSCLEGCGKLRPCRDSIPEMSSP